ncbi:MAG: glycosyltransferase family 4 protein [Patescibacteria group bacterium]
MTTAGKSLNIAWVSTHPAGKTGYGTQTEQTIARLVQLGYNLTAIAGGGSMQWSGYQIHHTSLPRLDKDKEFEDITFRVLPTLGDASGIDQWEEYRKKFGFDMLITLWDAFAIAPYINRSFPGLHYVPIDTALTPHMYRELQYAFHILAMSQYGYKELLKWFPPTQISYIPHGIDTLGFHPETAEFREQQKEKMGLKKDDFLVIAVAANAGERKELPLMLNIFKRFLEKHKNAYLYMFSNHTVHFPLGYNLREYRDSLGLGDHVNFPAYDTFRHPWNTEDMCKLYNTCDLYWSMSMGEGFGLPMAEAMACGLPVLGVKNSTHFELTNWGQHGWLAENVSANTYQNIPVWIPTLQQYSLADSESVLTLLDHIYAHPEERAAFGQRARIYVETYYAWSKVIPKWQALLNRLAEEITIRKEIMKVI